MELMIIVVCIGLLILGTREEVLKNKKVVNKVEEEENKYEKGTGLRFEAITEDDDIQDFSMNREEEEEEVELVDYLLDGLYGKVEGENLFGFTSVRKRIPQLNMDIQLLAEPKKEVRCELEGCPPMILRHFFGRDYVEPLVV